MHYIVETFHFFYFLFSFLRVSFFFFFTEMFFKYIFYFCSLICILRFCAFFVLLVLFWCFWCFWCFLCFLCVQNLFVKKIKNKKFKTALITSLYYYFQVVSYNRWGREWTGTVNNSEWWEGGGGRDKALKQTFTSYFFLFVVSFYCLLKNHKFQLAHRTQVINCCYINTF